MKRLFDFDMGLSGIVSYTELYVDEKNKEKFLSFLLMNGIKSKNVKDEKNGGLFVYIGTNILKNVISNLDKSGIIVYINNIKGLEYIINKYKYRIGLFLGLILAILTLYISTMFVSKIEVLGTEKYSKEEIINYLSKSNITVGSKIKDIDREKLSDKFLYDFSDISWVSFSFKGTVLVINIREKKEIAENKNLESNLLISKYDAIIRDIAVFEGIPVVTKGSVVKKGDVLISGYVSGNGLQITDNEFLRFEKARGFVKGEVNTKIDIFVPYEFIENELKETNIVKRNFKIFGLEIKDKSYKEYSKIKKYNLSLFGKLELPIEISEYFEDIYVQNIVVRDKEQLLNDARKELYSQIEEVSKSSEILKISEDYIEKEDGIIATANITYICELTEAYSK